MKQYRLGLLVGFLVPVAALAEEPIALDAIEVSAPRLERNPLTVPAAFDRVERDEVRRGREAIQLEESLNRVPGFFFQNRYNFAQGQRISSRGFGARAPFGVRGIRIRVDGFPETLPDGQSQVDMIDLDSVDRIETIRGPSSVLYGNATGGVIDVTTLDGGERDVGPQARTEFGRHGYRKFGLSGGEVDGPWRAHVSGSWFTSRGYRDQSEVRKGLVNMKATRAFGEQRELTGVLSAVSLPLAEDPGGLTREEAEGDRRQAAPLADALDTGQAVDQQRLGLTWQDGATYTGDLTARVFYTNRDFEQQLPFPGDSLIAFDRDFFGMGAEYRDDFELAGVSTRYIVGVDLDRQVDDRTRTRVDIDGNEGNLALDERQQATALGGFVQTDLGLTPTLDLTLGARVDRIRFRIEDNLTGDEDFSGNRRFTEPSHTVALGWSWSEGQRLYATAGTSFETPTFTEFANPDGGGGFNDNIEPAFAVNREVGARGALAAGLDYNVALFSVRVKDEIVVKDDDGPRDFFENAAQTRRDGVELGLEYFVSGNVTLSGSYTWADYRFRDFTDFEGNDFAGNRLPGLPRNEVFLAADWRGDGGRFAAVELRHVGGVFADNANDEAVDSYNLVNVRAGQDWRAGTGEALRAWIGIDNLFAEEYFANVRVNAAGGRFFEPAPERLVRAGVELTF